jgi:hypothetical protein
VTTDIFVLGLDEPNRALLRTLPGATDLRLHHLLDLDTLRHTSTISVRDLLAKAQQQLDAIDGHIDTIVGYWHFPVTQMVPILCDRHGLPAPSLGPCSSASTSTGASSSRTA